MWSPISFRIALAIYSRRPSAYRALCSFGIIKLPSLYSVRNTSMKGRQKPSIRHDYLLEQQMAYSEYKTEQRKKG